MIILISNRYIGYYDSNIKDESNNYLLSNNDKKLIINNDKYIMSIEKYLMTLGIFFITVCLVLWHGNKKKMKFFSMKNIVPKSKTV